MSLSPSEGFYS